MIYIDVDTAVEVPVNVAPLIDDTDFKSREGSVAYNAAGMDLVWNFVTPAGTITQTAVTPTTAGDYDWAEIGDAMYKIEIPASGGASINNDTEGVGYFTGIATGILPWRGPDIVFRAAALNDALIEGGDNLDVNAVAISGSTTAADNAEIVYDTDFATNYNTTNDKWQVEADLTEISGSAVNDGLSQLGVNVVNIGGETVNLSTNNQLKVAVDEWNDVPLGTTNPLPNAAADAAGGLPISDAGGLDLDAKLATATSALATAANLATVDTNVDAIKKSSFVVTETAISSVASETNVTLSTNLSYDIDQGIAIFYDNSASDRPSAVPITSYTASTGVLVVESSPFGVAITTSDTVTLVATPSPALGSADFEDGFLTAAKIATDAITNAKIASGAIVAGTEATGFATPTNITAGTITTVTNLTNAPTIGDLTATMKASVNTEVDTALTDIHLDHLLATAYDATSKPGAADALLNEMVEDDAGVTRYTVNALENGPSGSGASAASIRAEIDANSTQLAAIVADTNELQTNQGNWVTATGFATAAALATVDSNVDAILVDTNELQTNQGNWLTATGFAVAGDEMDLVNAPNATAVTAIQSGLATAAAVTTVDTVVDGIKSVTDNLPNSGALTDLATAAALATVDTNVDAILVDTGTTIPGTITTIDTNVDTLIMQLTTDVAEPGVPGATATVPEMVATLYGATRNKITVTSSAKTFHNDADAAVWSKALSDNGTTYTEAEGS